MCNCENTLACSCGSLITTNKGNKGDTGSQGPQGIPGENGSIVTGKQIGRAHV